MPLILTRKIRSAYRRYDFESAFIIGQQGYGKTTYAMLVLYELYGDWDKVLEHVVFDPREVMPKFKEALKTGKRVKAVVFDDAGLHLSKYLIHTGEEGFKLTMVINALFNLIRTICAGVIFTSPDMDILKELRKKSWIVGTPAAPHGKSQPQRQMILYRKKIHPSGRVYVSKIGVDEYRLDVIPKDVRKQYEEKRRAAMEPLLERLGELLEKHRHLVAKQRQSHPEQ